MDNWVTERVRTTARRRLVLWSLVLAAVLALFALQGRYLYNFAFGPFPTSSETLAGIGEVRTHATPFVRVQGEQVMETGIQEITVRKRRGRETSRGVSANYYALATGGRFLIVKSNLGGTEFEGELVPMPGRLSGELFSSPEMAANKQHFYPFILDTSDYRSPGYAALAAFAVFLFFFLRAAVPAVRQVRNPGLAPVTRRVATWGDISTLGPALQKEFGASRMKLSGWVLGENFLVRSRWLSFDVLRLEDLLWAYKHVTRQRIYFVPVGSRVVAKLHFVDGQASIQAKDKKLDEALSIIHERVPWALYGYDEELQKALDKHRDEIVRGVARRRQHWQAQMADAEAADTVAG